MKGGIFLPKPLKKDTHIKVYCSNKEKKIKKDKIENKVDLDRIFGIFLELFSLYLYFRRTSRKLKNSQTLIYQGLGVVFLLFFL